MERQDRQSSQDTIELDKVGNVIRVKSWWYTELRSYDSSNFLRRQREVSDITLNYILKYSLEGDTLRQIWREINSSDWNLDTDTSSSLHHVTLFEYDSKGRIVTEIQPGWRLIKYVYVGDRLVKKNAFTGSPMKLSHYWQYDYDNNSLLKRIVRTSETKDQEITNFLGGLPDSRNSIKSGQYKYHYVYYQ